MADRVEDEPPQPAVVDKDEYLAIIQKMSSNEAWAYSFVALYFAFLASISALVGYLLVSASDAAQSLNTAVSLLGFSIGLVDVLCAIGLALNVWAIAMVVDYKMTTKRLMTRLHYLEGALKWSNGGPPGIGRSYNADHMTPMWRVGQFVLVGLVMALFFAPWLLIILA